MTIVSIIGRVAVALARANERLVFLFRALAGLVVIGMMFVIVGDVVGRYGSDLSDSIRPIPGASLYTMTGLVYVVFLAMASIQALKGHIMVTFLHRYFGPRVVLIIGILSCAVGVWLYSWLAYESWKYFWHTYELGEFWYGEINYPMWIPRFGIPLGSFLVVSVFIVDTIRGIHQLVHMGKGEQSS